MQGVHPRKFCQVHHDMTVQGMQEILKTHPHIFNLRRVVMHISKLSFQLNVIQEKLEQFDDTHAGTQISWFALKTPRTDAGLASSISKGGWYLVRDDSTDARPPLNDHRFVHIRQAYRNSCGKG